MHANIAVVLFAVAMLLQQSHCIPTHRYVRETGREGQDWTSRIKEYLNKIPGYGSSSSESQSPSSSTSQPDSSSYQQGATAGSESAASEIHSSIATKEGSTSSSGFPSYTNYMPSQLSQYQNSIPSLPSSSSFPQYFNSKPSSSGAAAGTAGAASEPQAAIAAKEGSTSPSGFPSYTNYMPSQLSQYQGNIPSFPSSSSFTQYFNSKPSSSGAAAGTAGAASEPQAAIAAKEGSTSPSGFPSYTDYMPSQLSQYQNNIPSLPSSSSFAQYQNQIPQSMNPGQYFNSKPTGA